jgi:histidyl-tRNA synthetase
VQALASQHHISGAAAATLDHGLAQLANLIDQANTALPGVFTAELKIARGLDYYTGSVYETSWLGHEDLGSICSGGRYDSLARDNRATYPGVGLSVGVSRLVSRLITANLAEPSRAVSAACLVAVNHEAERAASDKLANQLRARGIPTDVAPTAAKFGKQISYAAKRSIPYVVFPQGEAPPQIKHLGSGTQETFDPATWTPGVGECWPKVTGLN